MSLTVSESNQSVSHYVSQSLSSQSISQLVRRSVNRPSSVKLALAPQARYRLDHMIVFASCVLADKSRYPRAHPARSWDECTLQSPAVQAFSIIAHDTLREARSTTFTQTVHSHGHLWYDQVPPDVSGRLFGRLVCITVHVYLRQVDSNVLQRMQGDRAKAIACSAAACCLGCCQLPRWCCCKGNRPHLPPPGLPCCLGMPRLQ